MNDSVKFTLLYVVRVLLYSVLMILLNQAFMFDAQNPTITGKFGEVSMTEILQEAFLFVLGIIFIVSGRLDKKLTPVSNLLSVFFFMAFIREFNNQIDFWFYLVLPLIFLFAWFIFRDRNKLIPSARVLLELPSVAYLVTGFLVTFVFSRFFGRTVLWEAIMESDYNRWVKNAAEEGIELLGYALFLIAGIEILISLIRKNKSAGQS
jgi:hypothetical protein